MLMNVATRADDPCSRSACGGAAHACGAVSHPHECVDLLIIMVTTRT